jgi:CBS domain-containing protein
VASLRINDRRKPMSVEHILLKKGRKVVTIEAGRTLAEAAHLLSERKIGAVVVSEPSDPVLGILSERDIVKAVARRGAGALQEPVSQSMTRDVVTCTGRSGINELMEMMTTGKFRHVPVVEGGSLVGIVSFGDIVKHRLAEVEAESQAMRDYIATA